MLSDLKKYFLSSWMAQVAVVLFVAITVWWFFLPEIGEPNSEHARFLLGSTYQVLAFWGGICGLLISRHWGGVRSIVGRSIIAFSIGLLLQVLGQSVYSYHNLFLGNETPYPSAGDIGFFGSIPAYIYGIFLLARACGSHITLRSFRNQLAAFLIPLAMLVLSYSIFLTGYEFDSGARLVTFLDFGYPLGQAIYVSLALLTFIISRNYLGGIMRGPIFFILVALVYQYVSDFTFLRQASLGTWYVGGIGDYLYFSSYFLMSLALIYLGYTYKKISGEGLEKSSE